MSHIHDKDGTKSPEPAPSASSPRKGPGSSPRLVLERTRLFNSHLDCILKDSGVSQPRSKGKGLVKLSPDAGLCHRREATEVSSVKSGHGPSDSPRPQLDFHLPEQEEPPGVEADHCDEGLQEPLEVLGEDSAETIHVTIEQDVADPHLHSSAENLVGSFDMDAATKCPRTLEPSDIDSSDNDECYGSKPLAVTRDRRKKKGSKRSRKDRKRSSESYKKREEYRRSTAKSSSVKNVASEPLKTEPKSSNSSASTNRNHHHHSSKKKARCSSTSGSPSKHQTNDSSKRKSECPNGPRDGHRASRSRGRRRSSSGKDRTIQEYKQAAPSSFHQARSIQEHVQSAPTSLLEESLNNSEPFNAHYKQKAIQQSQYDPVSRNAEPCYQAPNDLTPIKTDRCQSTHREIAWQQLDALKPLSKMSSSETFADVAVSSASDDEIIDHETFAVPNRSKMGSNSSSSSFRSESERPKLGPGSASHFTPFAGCSAPCVPWRPDTKYYLPASPVTPYSPYSSPSSNLTYHSSPSLPAYFNDRPPSPPPPMHQGIFQWSGNASVSPSTASLRSLPAASPAQSPALSPAPSPLLFAASQDSDRRFQRLQNLHEPPRPNYHGYQLIGDSMLLRFSQQLLHQSAIFSESLRFLGYCVSGQRVGELLKRLKSDFYHIGKKIVLMIGTNDLLKNTPVEQMCQELNRVVDHLCTKADEVVVLTIPPVPRLESQNGHWARLHRYNEHIKKLNARDSRISVFDLSSQYILTQEELEEEDMLAEFNKGSTFCHGCLTCMEDNEDFSWDSFQSDEDDIDENHALLSSSPPTTTAVDICKLFVDKRIPKCRLDCFEIHFSESTRKDMIHLNFKGLSVVKEELLHIL